jgi:hypothetical protein
MANEDETQAVDVTALLAQVASLQAAVKAAEEAKKLAEEAKSATVRIKVSEKGAIHFRGVSGTHHTYGMTLYPMTWAWLKDNMARIDAFVEANKATLSMVKPPAETK